MKLKGEYLMRSILLSVLTISALSFSGCEEKIVDLDNAPQPPQGVTSVTGDSQVFVHWSGPYESDLDYFVIYRSLQSTTGYVEIGQVNAQSNPGLDLIKYSFADNNPVNGTTYYYAVSSVDNAGQESELSAEEVFDTPRPDGSVLLYSKFVRASEAGFDFSSQLKLNGDAISADIFVDDVINSTDTIFFLNARDIETDIQDLGYTDTFDDIGYAVENGWSTLGYCEVILGHTYLVWTRDNHFAKVRVTSYNKVTGTVTLDWAYQTATGNLELAPPANGWTRPERTTGSKFITLLRESSN
jgi:hypothetical protein